MSAPTEIPVLSLENMRNFWNKAWATNNTGWRAAEQDPPFTRNIYAFLGGVPGSGVKVPVPYAFTDELMADPNFLSGPEEQDAVSRFVKGKTVLVPLCGDTHALRYFLSMGASTVMGVDISEMGLAAQRKNNFPDVTFSRTVHPLPKSTTNDEVIVYEGTTAEGGKVLLYEGDILKLRDCAAFHIAVDFVYDRAAFQAILPSMREGYLRTIAEVLRPESTILLERPVRDPDDPTGPPFTFTADSVRQVLEAVTHSRYDVHVVIEALYRKPIRPDLPKYFEFFGVYPAYNA